MRDSAYRDLVAMADRAAVAQVMAEDGVAETSDSLSGGRAPRPAAVLLLFGALDDVPATSSLPLVWADLDVLLVERAATLNDHPGQVAFPGGGVDAQDSSFSATALREAVEETGVDPEGVQILGELPVVAVTVSNFVVTPVLAWWEKQSPVDVVDVGESARVFRVPVRDLLDPGNRVTVKLKRGGFTYRGPAFTVAGVVVWGFTAAILDHLFTELGWAVPWDEKREIQAPL